MKAVCRTSLVNPSSSLLSEICDSNSKGFRTGAMEWGIMNEKRARSECVSWVKMHHENLVVKECGLVLHDSYPYFGASPDGFVSCDCCGEGVLEIKCPHKFRDCCIVDVVNDVDSRLVLNDRNVKLNK